MGSIKSFPNNRDEYVGAEYAMRWLHGRTSGVFAANNNAAVAAVQSAMAVTVSDGVGWLSNAENNGVVWWNDTEKNTGAKMQLTIDAADGVLNRIDRVIVEWKTTDYADLPEIKILKGTAASTAAVPALTNSSSVRQISLAQIAVAAGTTSITAGMITDERLDPSVCGLVTDTLSVDTSVINAQFAELLAQLRAAIEQAAGGEIPDGSITTPKLGANVVTRAKMAIDAFTLADNAGAHNAVYRGKNLGSAVTAAQWAAIEAGTFEDLFIGDYWTINDVNWRIAAFDYYYNTGDVLCTTHHVVIVPEASLYETAMNSSQSTAGGYVASTMYTSGLAAALATVKSAFGDDHILTHRQIFCNAVTNGIPSGYGFYDNQIALMTEQNVFGGKFYGAAKTSTQTPSLMTLDNAQYPLFAHNHALINVPDKWVGLRDVVSATSYARVTSRGSPDYTANITNPIAVRPAFSIKA
nr:MAG TPA: Receptor Binding Protein [Caudoviricetes sp.]